MRQFHVPQFIDVEDKIFGPLTLKQFLYIIGGAGIIFLMYAFLNPYLPLFIILTLAAPVGAFFMALAFYKVNGQSFMKVLESGLTHYTKPRLFIWKRVERQEKIPDEKFVQVKLDKSPLAPKTTGSRLKDLAWSLDVHQNQEPRRDKIIPNS